MKTSSSLESLSLINKAREAIWLLCMHIERRLDREDYSQYDKLVSEYDEVCKRWIGVPLSTARTLEIGFGARPLRLIWLHAIGVDIRGVDLDYPLVNLNPATLERIVRTNGLERLFKSFIRYMIADRSEWRAMKAALNRRYGSGQIAIPSERLIVSDAASETFWDLIGPIDFAFSEDVFEHIPPASVDAICRRLAMALQPRGVAIIRPMIYTGICGGHLVEWYPHKVAQTVARRSAPWEHLREKRYVANTYLNKMRLDEYEKIFSRYFNIEEVQFDQPKLGNQYLTAEIRQDLAEYSERELFANNVRFVLTPQKK